MEIPKNKKESAAAGKAGEPTAEKTQITLSAAGMADLLKSEFAEPEAKPETPPAKEIPAAGESDEEEAGKEVEHGEEKPEVLADGHQAEGEEKVEGEGEEGEAEEGHADETQVPAELQSELDKWEEAGGPLPPALQAVMGKRIGKLTAAREAEKTRADQAEAKLKAVTAEAEALKADPNRPVHPVPQTLPDEKTVATMATTAQRMVAEIENYLDESATEEERGRVERFMESRHLDAKGLKRELRQTNAFLTQELPKLQEQVKTFRQQEAAHEPIAQARFPWLNQKDTAEFQKAQEVLGFMPELRSRIPAHKAALGTWVVGLKVLEALNAAGHEGDALAAALPAIVKAFPPKGAAAKTAPVKTPPPKTPTGGSAAPGKTVIRKDDAARQTFNKTPNRQTATELARAALMAT